MSLEPDLDFQQVVDEELSIQVNADLTKDEGPLLDVPLTFAASTGEDAPLQIDVPLKIDEPVRVDHWREVERPLTAEAPVQSDSPLRMAFEHVPQPGSSSAPTPSDGLPLFRPGRKHDEDEPLIKPGQAPRAPLAVRRTLESPRLRAVARASAPAPALQFPDEPPAVPVMPAPTPSVVPTPTRTPASERAATHGGRRLASALIDSVILSGIDLGVVYFTVRLAGLSMSEWQLLPVGPMVAFLGLLKVAYFYAFTAVGGQTIGKMAVGTCVIADDGSAVDAGRAMRRTCAGVLSVVLLGLGFIPALFGHRLALHDRLARTRVVRLRSV